MKKIKGRGGSGGGGGGKPVILSRGLIFPLPKLNFNHASPRRGNPQKQPEKPPRLPPNCAPHAKTNSCGSPRGRNIVTDSSKHTASGAAIPGRASPPPHRVPARGAGLPPPPFQPVPRHVSALPLPLPPPPPPANFAPRSRGTASCSPPAPAPAPAPAGGAAAERGRSWSRSAPAAAAAAPARLRSPAGTGRFAPQQRLKDRERGGEAGGSCSKERGGQTGRGGGKKKTKTHTKQTKKTHPKKPTTAALSPSP